MKIRHVSRERRARRNNIPTSISKIRKEHSRKQGNFQLESSFPQMPRTLMDQETPEGAINGCIGVDVTQRPCADFLPGAPNFFNQIYGPVPETWHQKPLAEDPELNYFLDEESR